MFGTKVSTLSMFVIVAVITSGELDHFLYLFKIPLIPRTVLSNQEDGIWKAGGKDILVTVFSLWMKMSFH